MITVVVLFGIVAIIMYQYHRELKEGYAFAGRAAAPLRSRVLPVPQVYRDILQKYFPFYRQLNDANKNRFANEHEFFAVAVENFFERPQEFKNAIPELYSILSKLLNQDPSLHHPH